MKGKRVTAAELMSRLEKDPEYIAKRQRQEAERLERMALRRKAEAPIVADLVAAGFDVESVWDLVTSGRPYSVALPILLDHLDRSYPDDVRNMLGRALAEPAARSAWPRILQHYRNEIGARAKDALAVTLSEIADDELLDDLIALVRDPAQGPSRVLLLSALAKSKRPDARQVLEEMASDPDLEKEIRFLRKIERRCKN